MTRLSESGRCNCTSLRKASRRLSQFYDSCLAPSGLKSTQYALLSAIGRGEAPTIRELAENLAMDASTVGQNLLPLEREGLITIEPGPRDRRRRNVGLTPRGRDSLAAAEPLWVEAQARFERRFGGEDAAALRALLGRIVADNSLSEPDAIARRS